MKFRVEGRAVPKGRPRVTSHGTYTPQKTKDYEQLVRIAWRTQSGITIPEGHPISIAIKVHIKIPKSKPKATQEWMVGKYHIQKPDLDNLVKSITDALNGYAYQDDSQICSVVAFKVWDTEDFTDVLIGEAIGGAL